ncbi:transglutaminase domain-containing protein [Robiginitalea sp. M366]|uniref:transglutaminase domain-containing protein n=1 Tax=Robiginitalea aestuariiviva TaxID=3036903 RepID=UPI00240E09C3|nr:DUF3857 domain-containing protein [Robiginitalea aestuariiviva]MDG1570892.1 transglutaminase domain-containing protein [Robiginitalea aestuariiviva]
MKYLTTFIALITGSLLWAQDVKFGKVDEALVARTADPAAASVAASVVYRNVYIYYKYIENDGFHQFREVHERVKIYTKDGYDYATVSESLYRNGGDKEGMSSIKGATYNLVDGKVVEDKLRKSDQFSEEVNDYYERAKFTMPNVREGSVIEYSYTVHSPFAYSIDEIEMQYDIPIEFQEVRVEIPEYIVFKPQFKGYLLLQPEYGKRSGKINFTYKDTGRYDDRTQGFQSGAVDYQINTISYEMKDVPALVEEPFVNDMDNYRSAVNYELLYVQYPESPRENFSTTWDQVVERIYQNDNFGYQLNRSNYFKKSLEQLVGGETDPIKKLSAIFFHVQQHMNWNGLYGYVTDQGVRKAYEEQTGNVGDINLMLVAMLREAGLDARPVLLSTRDHGVPSLPTQRGFNYVVAQVVLDQGYVLMDATSKYTKPNLLPVRALNWFGRSVSEDGRSRSLSVFPNAPSKRVHFVNFQLDADGQVSGKLRTQYTDYRAYNFRSQYGVMEEEEYLENYENRYEGMEIISYDRKNANVIGKAIAEQIEFEMEEPLAITGDKIFFSPLLHLSSDENPFKRESREYPVDFAFPWQERYNVNIALPEGYEVTSLPESAAMTLPDEVGGFSYHIGQNGHSLQMVVELSINQAVVPATYYPGLRELFKNFVQKQSEQVVLTKTGSDGNQERTGGRR